jgi:hypothetical protein
MKKPEQRHCGNQRERADVQSPDQQRSETTFELDIGQVCQLGT